MMANFKLMPDPLDIREITFSNLLLLGFDVEEKEAQYRIPFTRDMFSVPNRKAMEVVFHFLFCKLNADSAKESFRHCWPIVDKKKEQDFRKVCSEWLTRIKRDDSESRLPTMASSLLLSPTGDRFYQFLFYFSTYVLRQRISALPSKYGALSAWPSLTTTNRKYIPQILRALIVTSINKKASLIDFMETIVNTKEEWSTFSRELSKEQRKLSKTKREYEKQQKQLQQFHEDVFGKGNFISSKDALRRTQNLQKITEFWKTISTLFEAGKSLEEILESVLNSSNKSLKGEDIHFKIPDILLRECERKLQTGKRYKNVYEGGKINLNSLIQLWNLSLHLIKEAYGQYPLPNVEHDEGYIRAHNHANSLNRTVTFNNTLGQKVLPDLKMSIEELKERIAESAEISSNQKPKTPGFPNKFNLDFLPATPPVRFQFNSQSAQRSATTDGAKFSSRNFQETPAAVDMLLHQFKKNTSMNMDQQDDTPVRGLPHKRTSQTAQKKKDGAFTQEKVMTTQKAPRSTRKAVVNKENKAPFTRAPVSEVKPPSSRQSTSSKIPIPKQVPPPTKTPSKPKQITELDGLLAKTPKAQQLLIDEIAQSVLNNTQPDDLSSSDTEENQSQNVHALDEPMEAFSTGAFESRDKVPRTPAFKSKIHNRRSPSRTSPRNIEESPMRTKESPVYTKESPSLSPTEHTQHHGYSEPTIAEDEKDLLQNLSSVVSENVFNLKALQERLRNITAVKETTPRQESEQLDNSTFENLTTNLQSMNINSTTTPYHGKPNTLAGFIDINPITPSNVQSVLTDYNPITPLRLPSSSSDEETPSNHHRSAHTPSISNDVDFTPIKTPWRKEPNGLNTPTDSVRNTFSITGEVDFTPLKTPWRKDSPNPKSTTDLNSPVSISSQTTEDLLSFTPFAKNETSVKPKSKLDLFLENNRNVLKDIGTVELTKKNIQKVDAMQSLLDDSTPVNSKTNRNNKADIDEFKRNNMIDFLTPFKSPVDQGHTKKMTSPSGSMTSPRLNISSQDVDDFIDEVMINTSRTPKAFSSLTKSMGGFQSTTKTPGFLAKTPGLFDDDEGPSFNTNDYTLMTPGYKSAGPFKLDFSDEDDEL
eukprot:TCONS_00015051-protein